MPPERPEVLALLSDCKENPEDATPRLVLADWLEERDDPRGSFLRAQVEAGRLPERSPQRREYEAQAAGLLRRHEAEWIGPLDEYLTSWEFAGGLVLAFAEASRLRDLEAADAGEALAWVEGLRLFDAGLHLPALTRSGLLGGVRALYLMYNGLGDGGLRSWLDAGPLPLLQELDLFSNGLTAASAAVLAHTPSLPGLRGLNLGDNPLGSRALAHFALATGLPRLQSLRLERVGLAHPEPVRARHGGPPRGSLPALHTLDLPDNDLPAEALATLLSGYGLPPLRRLTLRSDNLGDAGAQALAALPAQVAALEWLGLSGCGLTDTGAQALADCPHLGRVRTLILDGNQLTGRGVVALLRSPYLLGLGELSLQDMMFNAPPDVDDLLASPLLERLTTLGCTPLRHDRVALARLRARFPSLTLV